MDLGKCLMISQRGSLLVRRQRGLRDRQGLQDDSIFRPALAVEQNCSEAKAIPLPVGHMFADAQVIVNSSDLQSAPEVPKPQYEQTKNFVDHKTKEAMEVAARGKEVSSLFLRYPR